MLVVMIGIRKSLDFIFSRRELKILDDVMPEMTKRHQMLKDQEVGICRKVGMFFLGAKPVRKSKHVYQSCGINEKETIA